MHPAALDEDMLLKACDVISGRGSGPGGQHRNKVETAIRIVHRPTGITVTASERRHKEQNRKQAVFRLRIKLAVQVREPIELSSPPSELWRSRVNHRKVSINPGHGEFPIMLAEALDRLTAAELDPSSAAEALAISTSQLIKLLKLEPAALQWVNTNRAERGLHALR